MAHQDIKPSNVLVFAGDSAKVADLGRASQRDVVAPHDNAPFPGDPAYQPLEFLYGQVSADWNQRRQASDLYMLGSLALFLLGQAHTTAAVLDRLTAPFHPAVYAGNYAAALQYVRIALDEVLDDLQQLLREQVDVETADAIVTIIQRLCEPDPNLRGHPRSHAMKHGNPYSLERFVSEFNLLALRATRLP